MAARRVLALGCALALGFLILGAQTALGITPDSPEVKAMVEKALTYLATETHDQIGGKCLIALAFKKNGRDASHPKIKDAIDTCYKTKFEPHQELDNYNLGLMIIFLCELEDDKHKPLIQRMLAELLKRQKPHGGWGYIASVTGDTSQTQYACLAMWIADRHGFDVPIQHISLVMNWLIRTQDRYGGWGYQGNDPGTGQRIDQTPLTMSLAAAALGSLYIMQDLVIVPGAIAPGTPNQVKVPGALQEVVKKGPGQEIPRRPITGVDPAALRRAQNDGNAWMQKNFTLEPDEWAHYAFYAYERYASFHEIAENRSRKNQSGTTKCTSTSRIPCRRKATGAARTRPRLPRRSPCSSCRGARRRRSSAWKKSSAKGSCSGGWDCRRRPLISRKGMANSSKQS